jgi:hypothetical protein
MACRKQRRRSSCRRADEVLAILFGGKLGWATSDLAAEKRG